jgi:hypothetical protein
MASSVPEIMGGTAFKGNVIGELHMSNRIVQVRVVESKDLPLTNS